MLRLLTPIKRGPVVIKPWHPSPEDEAFIRATDATLDWLYHAPPEVLRPYYGKWVAALERRIVASGETRKDAMDQLEEKGIDDDAIVMLYIRKPGCLYIY
jgi:hypothetical protein